MQEKRLQNQQTAFGAYHARQKTTNFNSQRFFVCQLSQTRAGHWLNDERTRVALSSPTRHLISV